MAKIKSKEHYDLMKQFEKTTQGNDLTTNQKNYGERETFIKMEMSIEFLRLLKLDMRLPVH